MQLPHAKGKPLCLIAEYDISAAFYVHYNLAAAAQTLPNHTEALSAGPLNFASAAAHHFSLKQCRISLAALTATELLPDTVEVADLSNAQGPIPEGMPDSAHLLTNVLVTLLRHLAVASNQSRNAKSASKSDLHSCLLDAFVLLKLISLSNHVMNQEPVKPAVRMLWSAVACNIQAVDAIFEAGFTVTSRQRAVAWDNFSASSNVQEERYDLAVDLVVVLVCLQKQLMKRSLMTSADVLHLETCWSMLTTLMIVSHELVAKHYVLHGKSPLHPCYTMAWRKRLHCPLRWAKQNRKLHSALLAWFLPVMMMMHVIMCSMLSIDMKAAV